MIKSIERALKPAELGLQDLVDVTVFLKDMADFPAMNQIWNETFSADQQPARTTVCVVDLPSDNFVEMKAIAYRKGDGSPCNNMARKEE